ncbi:MAG: hypothetical protein FJY77_05690, partial [Candidatus Altiarchaeales archaeon]|nr:hypothetical protein [Candidatus Altiarchaeales archaeon]
MGKINVAVIGVGNCASSLVQGVEYYKNITEKDELVPGLMHNVLGGYRISDINFVAAFDVDSKKIGKDLSEAIFTEPNCTKKFSDVPKWNVIVKKGPVLDGVAETTREKFTVDPRQTPVDVASELKKSGAEVAISYLPVGSEEATRFYVNECLKAGCAFINAIPVFIASTREWAKKFEDKKLPIIGDDIKSQVGATILHRTLTRLFVDRGVKLDYTYQLNVGGNSVTGDQEIMLLVDNKLGKVTIGDFIDSYVEVYGRRRNDGKDVVVVDEVGQDLKCFTIDEEYNVRPSKIDAFIRHRTSGPIYEVTTEEGRSIKITGDHNVFVLSDDGNLEEIPVNNLRDDTYIAVPKVLPYSNEREVFNVDLTPHLSAMFARGVSDGYINVHNHPEIKIPVKFPITDDLLQIVGLWLADGNYDRYGSSNIEIACGNDPECMELIDNFTENLNVGYNIRNDVRVRLVSKTLAKVFKLALGLDGNAYTKRVPDWIFGLSDRQVGLVLRGYVSGDGGVTGKQVRWTSTSKGLLEDIQTLFLRLGVNSTVFKETYKKGAGYNSPLGHVWHGLISSKDSMGLFTDKVGFIQGYKNTLLNEAYRRLRRHDIHRIPNI